MFSSPAAVFSAVYSTRKTMMRNVMRAFSSGTLYWWLRRDQQTMYAVDASECRKS